MTIILLQCGCLNFRTVFFSKRCKMVRGCQKKIIYLKNTDSEVFDEAYFVVKDDTSSYGLDECDMIKEVNRILDECIPCEEKVSIKYKLIGIIKKTVIPFCLGIIIGVTITLLIK